MAQVLASGAENEAQTLANVYLALDANLEIVPVINKIDLPSARVDETKKEIEDIIGIPCDEACEISAKTGLNIESVLDAVVKHIPAPKGDENSPLKALIFDSYYDSYKGAVSMVRVFNGRVKIGDEITTIGGIMGRIVTVKDDSLIIETGADRNKMKITRWAVQANNTAMERDRQEREAAKAAAEKAKAEKKKKKEEE